RGRSTGVVPPSPPPVVVPDALDLVIDEPKDGALFTGDSVKVRGRAKGAATVEVGSVKAKPADADGAFELSVSAEGAETALALPIVAILGGKRIEKMRTVYRPPSWFAELPDTERPPLPLPKGLTFGARPLEYVNKKDESVLVWAPPTRFLMGGPEANEHAPPGKKQVEHEVELSGYFIGKFEVSVAQFEKFSKEARSRTAIEQKKTFGLNFWAFEGNLMLSPEQDRGINWRYPQRPEKGNEADPEHPVVLITPDDADSYCKWAGLKLPTEAQWERAAGWEARTGKSRRYPWGDGPASGEGVVHAADAGFVKRIGLKVKDPQFPEGTRVEAPYALPVTANEKGASPIGALNMAGNVAEWCRDALDADFYVECSRKVMKDPCLPGASTRRVHRGGHFASLAAEVQTKRRFYTMPSMNLAYRYPCDCIGFRVCRELGD
ncbi:MAG: formylglycine-generating enzyme family protein, partial [Planctomycetota bacterium]